MAISSIKENTSVETRISQDSNIRDEQSKKDQTKKKKKSILTMNISFGSPVSDLDVALTIRHLATMLKSGLSLAECIFIMSEQSHSEYLREVFLDIYEEVQSGITMATSMRKYPKVFSRIMVSIVDVGEQGGTLERNLLFLADFLKKNHELNSKVKGALTYPLIVLVVTVGEMLGVIFFIFPQLEGLFAGFDNIPATTLAIMSFSHFVRTNILYMAGFLLVFAIVFGRFLKTKRGQLFKDKLAISFPIMKNVKIYHILTNFSRTLGILLESGIPIVTALKISKETVGNAVYEEVLNEVWENVEAGGSLSGTMDKYPKYFPGTYAKMIQVGEETGALEENLMYLYDFYEGQVKEMSENLTTLLEPILLVFIAIMIGALAIIVVLPIYQLTGSVTEGV